MIPAIVSCNELISLHVITYNGTSRTFEEETLRTYGLNEKRGRVEFIVDFFKVLRWISSQEGPNELFHLPFDARMKTNNGHHVTFTGKGLLKEFSSIGAAQMEAIRAIYYAKLANVEHGTANCTTIMITRIGALVKNAMRLRGLSKDRVIAGVTEGVAQLHSLGYAHCDIRAGNIFVDDDNTVFIGDLEYSRPKDEKAPAELYMSDSRADTAGELDLLQLAKLADELDSL
jgi:hypothetical protein